MSQLPVLIVEDDRDTREAIAMALQCAGFAVEEAENGRVALDMIHSGTLPCLILLDLMMPVMDGQEFRRHQLFWEPQITDVPVIVFSAVPDLERTAERMGGVKAVLRKPIDPTALVNIVRSVAGN
jgi:CheY-like chemotaxis protein